MGTVLLVDDERDLAEAFATFLSLAGHEVTVASDGAEALSILATGTFDIVITDLRMPGSTGFDLQKRIAACGLRLPTIVLSASDDVQAREHARGLGAVAFFRKPVDDQALLDAIWWAISGARPSSNGDSKQ